uniref:Myb/SANT-like DNA-binding domain-containing protein n=1 Tax=Lepisosteus oculatus TaxID=7918 RepID=W5N0F1_LEPOC
DPWSHCILLFSRSSPAGCAFAKAGFGDRGGEEEAACALGNPVSANKLFPVPAVGKTTFQIAAAGSLPLPLASPGPSSEFTHQCILQLIEAVGKRWDMYSARERTRLFHNVQQELEALGHTFTMERIRRKWNNLVVTYKRVKDRSRETGQAKTTWEYYEMMDALLSNTIGAQPVATAAATMVTTLTPDA